MGRGRAHPGLGRQALVPLLADGGRIVNLSSGLTKGAFPGFSAYAAAKAAVEVLTLYMAKELGAGRSRSTPWPRVPSRPTSAAGRCGDNPEINQVFAEMTALGRVGLPDDIGPMVASLLSEDHRWVNARRIEVSGGQGI